MYWLVSLLKVWFLFIFGWGSVQFVSFDFGFGDLPMALSKMGSFLVFGLLLGVDWEMVGFFFFFRIGVGI